MRSDLPALVELSVGEAFSLQLRTAGTGGYSWYAEFDGASDVVDVELATVAPDRGELGSRANSASSDTVITLTAVREGSTHLVLQHRRPREAGGDPLEQLEARVVVN